MWGQHKALAVFWHPSSRLHSAEEVQRQLRLVLHSGKWSVACQAP